MTEHEARRPIRLNLNVDHCATLRQQRRGRFPDPVALAEEAMAAGVDGITAHLREDRRHIQDEDLFRLRRAVRGCLNMEMAATSEMTAIARLLRPDECCVVPERREELTTEGGLNAAAQIDRLASMTSELKNEGIVVSLFIEPDPKQVEAASVIGAEAVEFHTGTYAECFSDPVKREAEIRRLNAAATLAVEKKLRVHAGHGLSTENVPPLLALPCLEELNIGFYLIGRMLFTGVRQAVLEMRQAMGCG